MNIDGTLLTTVLQAIGKATNYENITINLGSEAATLTSDALSVSMPVPEHQDNFEFSVNWKLIAQVIKGLKTVTLTFSDDKTMLLIGDTSQTIGMLPIGTDVTAFPALESNVHFLNNTSKFFRSFTIALSTISIPGVKYHADDGLTTILVEYNAQNMNMVSTDGHRLTLATGFTEVITADEEQKSLNIPYKTCLAVHQLLKQQQKEKRVFTVLKPATFKGVDYLQIEAGELVMTAKCVPVVRFPQYRNVLPRVEPIAIVNIDASILKPIKRLWENRMALVDNKGKIKKQDLHLTFALSSSKSTITITSRHDHEQLIAQPLDATMFLQFQTGADALFVVDYCYFVTMLDAASSNLMMKFYGSIKPLTFHDTQGNLSLLMPMDIR